MRKGCEVGEFVLSGYGENQPSHLTVGTFGVPEKLLYLICDVGLLRKMMLVEPINVSFGEMIDSCQDSLTFELRRPPGMDNNAIHIVALLTLVSKIFTACLSGTHLKG